ncbi:hypothetical protein Pden_1082 [Paracoccus denitrificans PD1222]|uniref:Uncharacterized protein n=1 Tax=Paracoccus denitrificans (strain Pd 1222) TaxID=318586 RepID=A1B0Z7_PARDP|nr:hypothetical protein Pden_1082 [Paracoccus denitrificans PD1222]
MVPCDWTLDRLHPALQAAFICTNSASAGCAMAIRPCWTMVSPDPAHSAILRSGCRIRRAQRQFQPCLRFRRRLAAADPDRDGWRSIRLTPAR